MDAELVANWTTIGFAHAAERYHLPIQIRSGIFNTYQYNTVIPRFRSPDEIPAMEQRSIETLTPILNRLMSFWEEEVLAEIKQLLAFWEAFDLTGASDAELVEHLAETEQGLHRVTEIHFAIAIPLGVANVVYDDTYQQLFPEDGPFDCWKLVEGFDNISLRADRALWRLSRQSLASPEVRRVFESQLSSDVIPALDESEAGRAFLAGLSDYLNEFGHRFETWGLSRPSMLEDPTPVIDTIKRYMLQPDLDPEAMLAKAAEERERRLVELRRRLEGYPGPMRERFEQSLEAAQVSTMLAEDHNYWIDFRAPYEVRRVVLGVGRRLVAADAIDEINDVVHLSFAELGETLAHLDDPEFHRRGLVAERKAELEHFAGIQPPAALGTESPGPPPDMAFGKFAAKFFGTPPRPSGQPDVVNGAAGSPGVVRGPACVVPRLSEAGKLRTGDILVAPTTAPAWTSLFATAAGIVTDAGGPLSHCAVVAREYGIPAVVGTGVASSVLRDGQMIEVDGNTGVVRIVAND